MKNENRTLEQLTKGEFWRNHGKQDIMEPWLAHMLDQKNGNFHMGYHADWTLKENKLDVKHPWIISRQVFALSAAYLLYGEQKYLDEARPAVEWLLKHAWDAEFGGWFDLLDVNGQPIKTDKSQFNYLYVDTGLSMYYFVTKDPAVLKKLEQSSDIRDQYWWDQEYGGYVKALNRDLSVKDKNKDFGGQIVPVSGPWLYLYSATRDNRYLEGIERIFEVAFAHMIDPNYGWVLESFKDDWSYAPKVKGDSEVDLGHNVETAWVALRTYELTGDPSLLEQAQNLVDLSIKYGYNDSTHLWPWKISRRHEQSEKKWTHWWVEMYGNFISLYMYHLTEDQKYLDLFQQTANFWLNHFIDKDQGGDYLEVTLQPDGSTIPENRPESAYHSMEHILLVTLYTELWIEKKEVDLHFCATAAAEGEKLFVSPLESSGMKLEKVMLNDQTWQQFDRDECSVTLPKGQNIYIRATVSSQ